MTILTPMHADQFDAFAEACIADYARDNDLSGRWFNSNPLIRSRAEFVRILPQGLQTPNHFIYEIQDKTNGETVGFLWLEIIETPETRSGYVYYIKIKPEFLRRGHAKAALDLVEEIAAAQGLAALALHVFSFNTGAQALYRSVGYGITGFNMFKLLHSNGA